MIETAVVIIAIIGIVVTGIGLIFDYLYDVQSFFITVSQIICFASIVAFMALKGNLVP